MPKKNLKSAAGYLRCSTFKQDTSIEDQRTAILAYAKKHGYRIVVWYVDDGISGDDTENRTSFLRMWNDTSTRSFEYVICWDQDRFGRFDSLEAGYWIKPFRDAGIRLVTVNDGVIDWEDFTGRMMYAMKQEANNKFVRDLGRNVLRGQIEAAKTGSWVGKYPYGYRLEGPKKNRRLVLGDDFKVKIVQRIFREITETECPMQHVADRLNADGVPSSGGSIWRADAVKCILENVAYTGTFRFNVNSRAKYYSYRDGEITAGANQGRNDEKDWIVIPDNHDVIIDLNTFKKAEAYLAKTKTGRSTASETNRYLLSGLLRCGLCGANLHGLKSGKYLHYECAKQKYEGNSACEGTTVSEIDLLYVIANYLDDMFLSLDGKSLSWKADRKELNHPSDLPKAFAKVKSLIFPPEKPKRDRKRLEKQVSKLKSKITTVRLKVE